MLSNLLVLVYNMHCIVYNSIYQYVTIRAIYNVEYI